MGVVEAARAIADQAAAAAAAAKAVMTSLLKMLHPEVSAYRDRRFEGTQAEYEHALKTSCTVYVGNLSFMTKETQVHEVFSKVGDVKQIVTGLDKKTKTPCGFCFVIYHTRESAENCVKFINGTQLDDRPIRVDLDWGNEASIFSNGRQFGRGRSGGQVRDEYRTDYDPGRGGFGTIFSNELKSVFAAQAKHEKRTAAEAREETARMAARRKPGPPADEEQRELDELEDEPPPDKRPRTDTMEIDLEEQELVVHGDDEEQE